MSKELIKLSDVKEHPNNPRVIKNKAFKDLKKSIKNFPEMLELRGLLIDENNVILGGNMRFKAMQELGIEEAPFEKWTKELAKKANARLKSEGKPAKSYKEWCDQIVIRDNVSSGEWDFDVLANLWDLQDLEDYGLKVPAVNFNDQENPQEIEFSEYMQESQNYIVLTFENDIDWLNAQTHFGLKSVYSKRANGKPWSKGIGRVVNGAEYLKKLKENE